MKVGDVTLMEQLQLQQLRVVDRVFDQEDS
jgi:hypothetical protein